MGESEEDEPNSKATKKSSLNNKRSKVTTKKANNKSNVQKNKSQKEAKEAEDLLAKIRGNALARKERSFNGMLAGIEDRYAAGSKKKKKGKGNDDDDDTPDDEFERMRNEIEANRASKKRKK